MSEWVKLEPGCRMPPEGIEVLLTTFSDAKIFGPTGMRCINVAERKGDAFVGDQTWYGPEYSTEKDGPNAVNSVALAWMFAPWPYGSEEESTEVPS